MSYPSQPRQNSGCGCGALIAVLIVVAIYSGVRYFINQNSYEKAHAAYERIDCKTALPQYESVMNGWHIFDFGGYVGLSQQEHAACQAYLAAVDKQESGDPSGSILSYSDFIYNYGGSPLTSDVRNRIRYIIGQTNVETLANEAFCDQTDYLEQNGLFPDVDNTLPPLLYQCGHTYYDSQNYSRAAEVYEQFLMLYPNHSLGPEVEDGLARSIVAGAKGSGAGTIPAPDLSGSSGSGSTVVVIRNDSPNRLRIAFSGTEGRVEELSACSSCTNYTSIGPIFCPEQGPIGRYTLTPGQYDVVVQSISDTSVTPWTGTWTLASGDEYSSCFFLVTTTVP